MSTKDGGGVNDLFS